ncbi:DUF3427 domain-containing protein [Tomitella gaofuii]|uniref:DUF3427 domain-containing protein n=1 Tax=Tomitella gaofuii TaxID=2760083 RepID=UPI0015F992A0|nr:DUF3427 domain-containing protein [Tomitella gaofuii]
MTGDLDAELAAGVYETIRTRGLDERLASIPLRAEFRDVGAAEVPHVVGEYIGRAVTRALANTKPADRKAFANLVVSTLSLSEGAEAETAQISELAQLVSLAPQGMDAHPHPQTPLSDVALLTNAEGEPALANEISSELASADRVDLLCAFVRFTGIRVLDPGLRARQERGVPLRVITTTYVGATERRALDVLVREYGAQVKVRYEDARTRLHAKAWLFRRDSGFDTGYVGSSNLSRSAMLDGLEWNVRISGVSTPNLVRKFEATFDTYWNDPAFITYDPDTDAERLDEALARGRGESGGPRSVVLSGLELRPRPFQLRILEALRAEREVHDRHRNLIVAATGTGKTVVAAIDYRDMCGAQAKRPSLLFVAHRKEILEQALRVYREALNDGSFGELLVDGLQPTRWRHVFASIQSLRAVLPGWPVEKFDVVVVDEFHHAEAATYRALLDHLQPVELLGLTATPERADGVNVMDRFGGRAAFELRLWDALREGLLCPFHYFGVADNTDLRHVRWRRGGYDLSELGDLYTGDDARVRLVIAALQKRVTDPQRMSALGFCVSVEHAEFMAKAFTSRGIAAQALSGSTPRAARAEALADLRDGRVQCLFAVDLFNEGLDLPDVDTLLMLRPTESATVFLQQLGRGLRLTPRKPVLTVLDFIGQPHDGFRFDGKFRALTGSGRTALVKQAEEGFPFLPSGCSIVLDRVAQETVLTNLKQSLRLTSKQLIADVRSHGTAQLGEFLAESGHELPAVYPKYTWTDLTRGANLNEIPTGPGEKALLARIKAFTHVDDRERADAYRAIASVSGPRYNELTPREQAYARMLIFTLFPRLDGITTYDAAVSKLRACPAVCAEIDQIIAVSFDLANHVPEPLRAMELRSVPLYSHASYRREEILAAIGWASLERKAYGHAAGVVWAPESAIDALFVTVHKDEGRFSPTTMYRDFPMSRELFHWESQNSASPTTKTGRRYLDQRETGSNVLLFTRDHNSDELGSAPYMLLGDVDYVDHRGERPIAITWKLRRPMPEAVYQAGAVVGE